MTTHAESSPSTTARIAGVFYLLVFLTGGLALFAGGRFLVAGDAAATARNILANEASYRLGWSINVLATVCYIVVTALFYDLFKPVSRKLSLTAAFFSLIGCATGGLSAALQLAPLVVLKGAQSLRVFTDQLHAIAYLLAKWNAEAADTSLVFFGFYCLLIGWLILKSAFLPRILGVGMIIAGLGWLTFIWPPLSANLAPYNFAPGILGEALLTIWLIAAGVNTERWQQQAASQG
jgi:hypothetical protein